MKLLPIKAIYSIGELAEACGVDRRTLARVLVHEGVELFVLGKRAFVSLSEIERKLPPFFDGLVRAQALLHALSRRPS